MRLFIYRTLRKLLLYTNAMTDKGVRDSGSVFGQEQPPLYIYIKGILQRYPGGQIFKVYIREGLLLCAGSSSYKW